MRAAEFRYQRCDSLAEAVSALTAGSHAVALAGGQSLVPLLRSRLLRPEVVVDISRISDLADVAVDGDTLRIGALTTVGDLDRSDVVARRAPLLAEAANKIADLSIRNMGTVGGNLAHADPLNDLPVVLVAGRGHVETVGPEGSRRIEADEFIVGPFTTALRPGELIRHVVLRTSTVGAYEKFKRAAVDFGIAAVGVQLWIGEDGRVAEAGIAVAGSPEGVSRPIEAERHLAGFAPSPERFDEAASAVAASVRLVDDERGSARYQAALVRALAGRVLTRAGRRAQEMRE